MSRDKRTYTEAEVMAILEAFELTQGECLRDERPALFCGECAILGNETAERVLALLVKALGLLTVWKTIAEFDETSIGRTYPFVFEGTCSLLDRPEVKARLEAKEGGTR